MPLQSTNHVIVPIMRYNPLSRERSTSYPQCTNATPILSRCQENCDLLRNVYDLPTYWLHVLSFHSSSTNHFMDLVRHAITLFLSLSAQSNELLYFIYKSYISQSLHFINMITSLFLVGSRFVVSVYSLCILFPWCIIYWVLQWDIRLVHWQKGAVSSTNRWHQTVGIMML